MDGRLGRTDKGRTQDGHRTDDDDGKGDGTDNDGDGGTRLNTTGHDGKRRHTTDRGRTTTGRTILDLAT